MGIPKDAKASGLKGVREQLRVARNVVETAYDEGVYDGIKIRLQKSVNAMRENGLDDETIARLLKEDINIIKSL